MRGTGRTAAVRVRPTATLVANFKDMEIDSQFAQPLQNLQKAMSGTGATVIVLHHTAKSGISSVVFRLWHQSPRRIPDVIISMEALNKNSDQLILTSSKRMTPTCLLIAAGLRRRAVDQSRRCK